ncbi:MAG: type II secretion system F family protein [Coriobacteriales bacterium]|jgi:tight adherence protein B|nr:type II secretion system F family protein [Coriobacteriales bacterium]
MAQFAGLVILLASAFGAISAALLAYQLAGSLAAYAARVRLRGRLIGTASADDSSLKTLLIDDLCRNGVPLLRYPSALLLRITGFNRLCQQVADWLTACYQSAFSQTGSISARNAAELLVAFGLSVGLLAQLLFAQPLIALAATALPAMLATQKAGQWHRQLKLALREQLPDALTAIGMCFSAGYSLEQALLQTARECPEPLSAQLARTANDIRAGCSVGEALSALEQRTALADVRFVTTALEIQHTTGGSLKDILASAAESIAASFELARSLEVQTAQARMSAKVVSIMPVALVCVLSLAMEGYLASFFSSSAGLIILVVAAAMETVGIILIRRILAINLE